MKRVKSCNICSRGITNNFNRDILCWYKGIVSCDYICPKFKAVSETEDRFNKKNKCIGCEFFIPETVDSDALINIGYCQLFTVRQFNGESKKACSKFCPKRELSIS